MRYKKKGVEINPLLNLNFTINLFQNNHLPCLCIGIKIYLIIIHA